MYACIETNPMVGTQTDLMVRQSEFYTQQLCWSLTTLMMTQLLRSAYSCVGTDGTASIYTPRMPVAQATHERDAATSTKPSASGQLANATTATTTWELATQGTSKPQKKNQQSRQHNNAQQRSYNEARIALRPGQTGTHNRQEIEL